MLIGQCSDPCGCATKAVDSPIILASSSSTLASAIDFQASNPNPNPNPNPDPNTDPNSYPNPNPNPTINVQAAPLPPFFLAPGGGRSHYYGYGAAAHARFDAATCPAEWPALVGAGVRVRARVRFS